jgi:hypothetical protein
MFLQVAILFGRMAARKREISPLPENEKGSGRIRCPVCFDLFVKS